MANPPTPTPNGSRQGGPPGLHPAGFLNPRPRAYSFFLFFLSSHLLPAAAAGFLQLQREFLGHAGLPWELRARSGPLSGLPLALAKIAIILGSLLGSPATLLLKRLSS